MADPAAAITKPKLEAQCSLCLLISEKIPVFATRHYHILEKMTNKESKNRLTLVAENQKPWYENGLSFKCTGCGKCCTGFPGYVWIDHEDITILAQHFKMSEIDFIKKYCRKAGSGISLKEDSKDFSCVFLKDNMCTAYHARPKQCRTFPWWRDNVKTERGWKELAKHCEGINHPDGEIVHFEEIQKQIRLNSARYSKAKKTFREVLDES